MRKQESGIARECKSNRVREWEINILRKQESGIAIECKSKRVRERRRFRQRES